MADKGKGKKDAQPKKESKSSGEVIVNVESKSNEGLLEKEKRGRCDCRLPFTSRGEPKASPPLSDAPQKNLEASWFTYILWIVLPLLAAGVVGYALYLAIHIANAPQAANHIVQPQAHQGQQPQFLEQMLDEPVLISSLSDEQLEAILAERRSQRESAMDSDGGDSDSDADSDTDDSSSDESPAASGDDDDASDDDDDTELPQAPAEDGSDATDTDTDADADPSALIDESSNNENEAAQDNTNQNEEQEQAEEEHENEEVPGAMPLEANPAASTLLQLKNSVHRRAAEAKKHRYE